MSEISLHADPRASETSAKAGPWSSSWVRHYDQASRRRHQMGGHRQLRAMARRKKRAELIAMACAAGGVLALVAVFYKILSR